MVMIEYEWECFRFNLYMCGIFWWKNIVEYWFLFLWLLELFFVWFFCWLCGLWVIWIWWWCVLVWWILRVCNWWILVEFWVLLGLFWWFFCFVLCWLLLGWCFFWVWVLFSFVSWFDLIVVLRIKLFDLGVNWCRELFLWFELRFLFVELFVFVEGIVKVE